MISNSGNIKRSSSIKDFLRNMNRKNSNSPMSFDIPSTSNGTADTFLQPSMTHPLSQLCGSSLSSSLHSSQSVPTSLRNMPVSVLHEIRQHQQQQVEDLKEERLQQIEAKISGIRSQLMPSQQEDALLLETYKKENTNLWERLKYYEATINNLEETRSNLARTNARLEVNLRDQMKMNNNLVQRNTDIVLDTSAKDQQIYVLKKQKKCLVKQNGTLKLFLRNADSCLGTLQSQQQILQLQQEEMQRNAATAAEGDTTSSDSKKRKRDHEQVDEPNCAEVTDGESTRGKDVDDCDAISIYSDTDENTSNNTKSS